MLSTVRFGVFPAVLWKLWSRRRIPPFEGDGQAKSLIQSRQRLGASQGLHSGHSLKTVEQFKPKWQPILFHHQKLFRRGKAIFGCSSSYRGIKHAVTETVAARSMLFLLYVTAEDHVMCCYESRGSSNDRHKEKRWTFVAVVGENALWPNSY